MKETVICMFLKLTSFAYYSYVEMLKTNGGIHKGKPSALCEGELRSNQFAMIYQNGTWRRHCPSSGHRIESGTFTELLPRMFLSA